MGAGEIMDRWKKYLNDKWDTREHVVSFYFKDRKKSLGQFFLTY